MTDDDDLFAVRPAPVRVKTRKTPTDPPKNITRIIPSGPVTAYACRCGARDEVKGAAPDALDCWQCKGLETMQRYAPRYAPPATAGRFLTPRELEGMKLDTVNAAGRSV